MLFNPSLEAVNMPDDTVIAVGGKKPAETGKGFESIEKSVQPAALFYIL